MKLFFILLLLTLPICSAETYFYSGSHTLAVKNLDGIEYQYSDRLGTDVDTQTLPFGQTLQEGKRFGYTGKEKDDSELHYYGARYYYADTGRFTSSDPIEGSFPYEYVHNNPLNRVDPTGLATDFNSFKGGFAFGYRSPAPEGTVELFEPILLSLQPDPDLNPAGHGLFELGVELNGVGESVEKYSNVVLGASVGVMYEAAFAQLFFRGSTIAGFADNLHSTQAPKNIMNLEEELHMIQTEINGAIVKPYTAPPLTITNAASKTLAENPTALMDYARAMNRAEDITYAGRNLPTLEEIVDINTALRTSDVEQVTTLMGIRGITHVQQVGVRQNGFVYIYPPSEQVPGLMAKWYRMIQIGEEMGMSRGEIASMAREYAIKIHPFSNGNGRTFSLIYDVLNVDP